MTKPTETKKASDLDHTSSHDQTHRDKESEAAQETLSMVIWRQKQRIQGQREKLDRDARRAIAGG